jgi:hypothetical protein
MHRHTYSLCRILLFGILFIARNIVASTLILLAKHRRDHARLFLDALLAGGNDAYRTHGGKTANHYDAPGAKSSFFGFFQKHISSSKYHRVAFCRAPAYATFGYKFIFTFF